MDKDTVAIMGSGSVQYSLDEAVVSLEDLLEALEEMRDAGITHVVASSGNYRGAQYASLSTRWERASEQEDWD